MGNCFGKPKTAGTGEGRSSGGNFQGQGRTLGGSAPAPAPAKIPASSQAQTAPVPASVTASQAAAAPAAGQTLGTNATAGSDDPKSAAARAAEERAKASQPKGKLGRALDAQKSQTQAGTLAQNARDNVAARNADAAAEARTWN